MAAKGFLFSIAKWRRRGSNIGLAKQAVEFPKVLASRYKNCTFPEHYTTLKVAFMHPCTRHYSNSP